MSELQAGGFQRFEGMDVRNTEVSGIPVRISHRVANFWGDVFNKEIATEIDLGNIPPNGDENSLAIYLQGQFAHARVSAKPSVEVSSDDVDYCGVVYNTHEEGGILPPMEEGFSPLLELLVSYQNTKKMPEWLRKKSVQ